MFKKTLCAVLLCLAAAGCSQQAFFQNGMVEEAKVTDTTKASEILSSLPAPAHKLDISVYQFQDQTGQFKNNGAYTDYSSAVTKGGYAILVKALMEAGRKPWFTVIERGDLKDLLQERNIIQLTRKEYLGPNGKKLPPLPPLLYGGVLIEGGIVSYDSNVVTGGAGAVYLGIGASTQYHRDVLTIYLRAVSVKTGEVLVSVTSSKTIYSTELDANLLKYVTFDRLLQAEAGITANEPTQLAVRQAVETGVYSLIMEGALRHLWSFADPVAGRIAMTEYLERRDGGKTGASFRPAKKASPAPQDSQWPSSSEPSLRHL